MRAVRVLLIAALAIVAIAPRANGVEAVTLRVAFYPYVPDRYAIFTLLAREFQRQHEGTVVQLIEVDQNKDYYEDGLSTLDADIYEIDSILLSEMLTKIAPLNAALSDFAPEAIEAVTRNGQVYAIPHWLCGNFLFFRKDQTAIRDAQTWDDLAEALHKQRKAMIFDLFGRLTLGEWYITLLAERVGMSAAQAQVMAESEPDSGAVDILNSILATCPTGLCRSKAFHDRTGYYARAFVRGEALAYIGYSETLRYGLQEAIDNCGLEKSCLSPNEIAVRRLPGLSGNAANEGVGWVDGLAISAQLSGVKRDLALKFIEFVTSPEGYKLALEPASSLEAPRYLLPARKGLAIKDAPLYADMLAAHVGRKTGTLPGLNAKLHSLAPLINCRLPADRTDFETAKKCVRQ